MIQVVDYDANWLIRFLEIQAILASALERAQAPFISIEHVGSTSVPGLPAKPILDVDIVVKSQDVTAASDALVASGFRALGELGIKERWAFDEPSDFPRANVYVVVEGSLALRNHLAVRDILRANPQLRDEYGALKRSVAAQTNDIDTYVLGKSEIIQRILAKSDLTEAERKEIDSQQ